MLYDRQYMREPQTPRRKNLRDLSAVQILLLVNVAVFVLGLFFEGFLNSRWLVDVFGLSFDGLKHWRLWGLLSYSFLHGTFLHIFLNMLVLHFMGPHLEVRVGKLRFYGIYFAAVVAGGLMWLLVELITGSDNFLVGASAGVFGVFTAFCMLEADRKMTFLLFFVFPLQIRPRVLIAFAAGFEFFNFLFNEIAPYSPSTGVGYSAHLGGILAGVFASFVISGKIKIPFGFNFTLGGNKYGWHSENAMTDSELKAEVNKILDKINARGFTSLTDREKDILSIAKDRLK